MSKHNFDDFTDSDLRDEERSSGRMLEIYRLRIQAIRAELARRKAEQGAKDENH